MTSKQNREQKNYNFDDIAAALEEIKSGKSIREASQKYKVPKSTLADWLKNGPSRKGRSTYLTTEEEKKIVKWIENTTKCGFPRKKCDLLNTVQKFILEDRRETPFKDGKPGRSWYEAFLKRHPEMVERTAESISKGRAVVTEEAIRKWFRELKQYLVDIDCFHILSDPNRVYNGDETSFSMCPKTGKVLAPKGYRNVYDVTMSNEKDTLTILLVFSAAGVTLPPMIVYPYKRIPVQISDNVPDNWILGKTDSGWMQSETFHDYVVNGLNEWLNNQNIAKPIILFVDGHKSHLTLQLSDFCAKNNIILYALPPNTTHMLQPADVSVFRPLKQNWKTTVREWQGRNENINQSVNKFTFGPIFKELLDKVDLKDTIKNGFRSCGLFPFNPNAIDYTKCVQNLRENLSIAPPTTTITEIETTINLLNKIEEKLTKKGFNVALLINEIKNSTNYSTNTLSTESTTDIVEPESGNNEDQILITQDANIELERSTTYNFDDAYIIPSDLETTALFGEKTLLELQEILNEESSNNVDTNPPIQSDLVEFQSPSSSKTKTSSYCSPVLLDHLKLPEPIKKKGNKPAPATRTPSALSSVAWRKIMLQKEEEKRTKAAETQERIKERQKKKEEKLMAKYSKKRRTKCASCRDELVSDIEDDEEKNVGCDTCTKWYHLKCTAFTGQKYDEIENKVFICQFCQKKKKKKTLY